MRARGLGLAFAVAASLAAGEAQAFDFFGLFGGKTPTPSQTSLPYALTFEAGGNSALEGRMRDASTLYRLRQDAPPDGETLASRAQVDLSPLVDALWGEGYYDAKVEIVVAGKPLRLNSEADRAAAVRAAEAYRNREAVPVVVKAEPGQQFALRKVTVTDTSTRPPHPADVPEKVVKLKGGDPAQAGALRAADARIVDYYRDQSRPLAKSQGIKPVVDFPPKAMDVDFLINPGPVAGFGDVSITGTKDVDPRVVRSFIYLEPGDPYSPKAVADTRKSILTIPALSSARIREADRLDTAGNLPLFVEVTERPKRVVGGSVRYSTIDGPQLRAYWEHRNLFGGAEQLRFEGETFLAPRNNGTRITRIGDLKRGDIGGRLRATFIKPALNGSRNDLLTEALVERDRTGGSRFGGYTERMVRGTASIRHRFSDTFSVQAGVAAERGRTSDVLGNVDYTLIGLPLGVTYDSTDRPLDPTRGIKVTGSVTPWPSFLGSTVGFVESKGQASAYYAVDEDARVVLAGRLGLGSNIGADLADIPSNHRFYAGGASSVRGFRDRSLSPRGAFGFVTGGRSLLEMSFEARVKITDTIGIVPFVDAGNAFEDSVPDFKDKLRVAAGLGLRYYTPIGPIRLDVAAPLNRRPGDKPVSLYISIGQAF